MFRDGREGEETSFCELLGEILAGHKPVEELFECPVFKRRLLALCIIYAHDRWNADEVYVDVCIKVWKVLRKRFVPDFNKPFGNFFAWLGTVARRKYLDRVRPAKHEFPLENLENIGDIIARYDVENQFDEKEVISKLMKAIDDLNGTKRSAVIMHLIDGYSCREVAEILTARGEKCSHASVAKWVRDILRSVFPESERVVNTKTPDEPDAAERRAA